MSTPTQTRYPWRASIRTAVAVIVALAAMLPALVAASGVDEALAPVAGALAIATAITRIMALGAVDRFLQRFLPWLAAASTPTVDAEPLPHVHGFASPAAGQLVASVACPAPGCGQRFEIPVTTTLYGIISSTDTGCIEVTRPWVKDVEDHIAAHRAAQNWPSRS